MMCYMVTPLGGRRSAIVTEVEVDFGAGPTTVHPAMPYVDLTGNGRIRVPAEGAVDWSQLDKLPQCITVEWSGAERGVIDAVAARRIKFLYWHDASGDIDLTGTGVTNVRMDGIGLRSVRLPESVEVLLLRDPPEALRVDAPESGHRMDLRFFSRGPDIKIPEGLSRVSKLWLKVAGKVSASALTGLTDLDDLRITFDDPPGALTDTQDLQAHHGLRTLQLGDAYGWDPGSLPELPSLRYLEINGTRRTTAAAVKARFHATGVQISVRGAKSEAWLAAHMTNPFRDWVEDSKPFGSAACKAYARALLAVEAVTPEAPDRMAAAERALRGLIADLNAIDAKYHLIDTIYREQAGDAFFELAERAKVPADQAQRWFDDRDF
jgi:hypothetical protein